MKTAYIYIIVIVIFFGLPMAYWAYDQSQPGKYDGLATCIKDSGTKFYGAFWCSHCANQKTAFGKSAALLPYVECSTADQKGLLPVCAEVGIKSFPTWVFPDGTRQEGEIAPEVLAEKTGCVVE